MNKQEIWKDDLKFGDESVTMFIENIGKIFPEIKISKIKRVDSGQLLDRSASIDLVVSLDYGDETWAIKSRKIEFMKKKDVTLEIRNGNQEKDRGDYYRFKTGVVTKYIYFWRDKRIEKLWVLDAKKLANLLPLHSNGPINKNFDGLKKVNCFQNYDHGRSFFTTISYYPLKVNGVIELEYLAEQPQRGIMGYIKGWSKNGNK